MKFWFVFVFCVPGRKTVSTKDSMQTKIKQRAEKHLGSVKPGPTEDESCRELALVRVFFNSYHIDYHEAWTKREKTLEKNLSRFEFDEST